MTSGATCGLTATTAAATSPIPSRGGLRRTPRAASSVRWPAGAGSTMARFPGASPSASQPSSRALPILPAPASRMVPDRWASGCARSASSKPMLPWPCPRHRAKADDPVTAALAIGKWCGAARQRRIARGRRADCGATPGLASRTSRRRGPRARACPPTPRTGRRGSSVRRRRARFPAAPRIAGSRPRRRRPAPARAGT